MDGSPRESDTYDMTDAQYQALKRIISDYAGIHLGDSKKELLLARLGKVLRHRGIRGYGEYLRILREDATGEEQILLLDAISTNVTHFFREAGHFEFLAERLAEEEFTGNPRIWSAGCSSGEEPYSIAVILREFYTRSTLMTPCIFATDLSTRVLSRAVEGVYSADSAKDMDPALLRKYFLRGKNSSEGLIRVKRELSSLVEFQRQNLMDPLESGEPFHFIFCRNVMIYFDNSTRHTLVERFFNVLEPGGYLIIGHSESLSGIQHQFRYVQPTIYRKA